VHPPRAATEPSPVRAAPPRSSTPLPGSFRLAEDPSTTTLDNGDVFLGGSPLRLFRVSERARGIIARWQKGEPVGGGRAPALLARRLVSGGAFTPMPDRGPYDRSDVTVVIPVRDRPSQLDRLLTCLEGLRCIVVDDASRDAAATSEICTRHGARLVGLATNAGPGGARNRGLALAETAVVAFVDSDCEPPEGWLEPLLAHFEDPLVAAVAPRVVSAAHDTSSVVARYEAVRSSLDRGGRAGPVRPGSSVPFVPSAVFVVRTEVVDGHELFDPQLRSGEDVDLEWRLVAAGWDVRYEPGVVVAHDGAATVGAFLSRRRFYGTSAGPLALRHGDAMAPLQASGWSVTVWLLGLLRRPGLAMVAQATSIVLLAHRLRGLVRDPVAVATTIAGGGTARAAVPALGAMTRVWSPVLMLGLFPRRTRRLALIALLLPALRDRRDNPGSLDAARYVGLHVADDVAYASGVWSGCLRTRTAVPLLPRVTWRSRTWSSEGLQDQLKSPAGSTDPSLSPAHGDG
jgi:mycofactocin system glycosyltransferase